MKKEYEQTTELRSFYSSLEKENCLEIFRFMRKIFSQFCNIFRLIIFVIKARLFLTYFQFPVNHFSVIYTLFSILYIYIYCGIDFNFFNGQYLFFLSVVFYFTFNAFINIVSCLNCITSYVHKIKLKVLSFVNN